MCCFSRQCNARVCARLTTRGGVWGGGGSDVRHIRHAMSRFSKTALTLVETSVVLREGRVTASDLLQSAIARMTITRHLNAFIGGVLPGAAKAAETRAQLGTDQTIQQRTTCEPHRQTTVQPD